MGGVSLPRFNHMPGRWEHSRLVMCAPTAVLLRAPDSASNNTWRFVWMLIRSVVCVAASPLLCLMQLLISREIPKVDLLPPLQ